MKKRRILLALLALALAVTTVLPAAMAYFSTNTRTEGSQPLKLGGDTEIEEDFSFASMQKTVTITATEGSQPMWVRARAYAADPFNAEVQAGTGWEPEDDGWYYYEKPLAAYTDADKLPDWLATEASAFVVKVSTPEGFDLKDLPEGFEVPVVYQTAPVQYNPDGSFKKKDGSEIWSNKVMTPEQLEADKGGNA